MRMVRECDRIRIREYTRGVRFLHLPQANIGQPDFCKWAPIDPMGTLEPYLGPIRPMLLIPNGAVPVISPAGTLASSPFPGLLRLIWLTISLPWPCATYGNVRQGALYRSQKRSTEAFYPGKSIFVGMPSSGQQACHRPLYGSGSAYQAENHHSLSATVFANLRLTSHAWSGRRTYTRPSA